MEKPAAVVDTSFWSTAVHAGIDAYLPLFFARPILVPTAVVREVERIGQREGPRLREDQQRFRLWLEDGRLVVQDPREVYPRLGAGEAAALGVALERLGTVLLINESKGYLEARRLGVRAVTVPETVVRLARDGRVARPRAEIMLDVLEETTGTEIVERARRAIAQRTEGGQEP